MTEMSMTCQGDRLYQPVATIIEPFRRVPSMDPTLRGVAVVGDCTICCHNPVPGAVRGREDGSGRVEASISPRGLPKTASVAKVGYGSVGEEDPIASPIGSPNRRGNRHALCDRALRSREHRRMCRRGQSGLRANSHRRLRRA